MKKLGFLLLVIFYINQSQLHSTTLTKEQKEQKEEEDEIILRESFFKACKYGNKYTVIDLTELNHHLLLVQDSTNKENGLHIACKNKHPNIISVLLESDSNEQTLCLNKDGKTPIILAIEKSFTEGIELLLKLGRMEQTFYEKTKPYIPLITAIDLDKWEAVKLLIKKGDLKQFNDKFSYKKDDKNISIEELLTIKEKWEMIKLIEQRKKKALRKNKPKKNKIPKLEEKEEAIPNPENKTNRKNSSKNYEKYDHRTKKDSLLQPAIILLLSTVLLSLTILIYQENKKENKKRKGYTY